MSGHDLTRLNLNTYEEGGSSHHLQDSVSRTSRASTRRLIDQLDSSTPRPRRASSRRSSTPNLEDDGQAEEDTQTRDFLGRFGRQRSNVSSAALHGDESGAEVVRPIRPARFRRAPRHVEQVVAGEHDYGHFNQQYFPDQDRYHQEMHIYSGQHYPTLYAGGIGHGAHTDYGTSQGHAFDYHANPHHSMQGMSGSHLPLQEADEQHEAPNDDHVLRHGEEVVEANTQDANVPAMVIPVPDEVYEYKFRVDPATELHAQEDVAVYEWLQEAQTFVIMDRIRRIRPYTSETIRARLRELMDGPFAIAALGDDEVAMENKIVTLFPMEARRRRDGWIPWMNGFTNAQRRRVIDVLAKATSQATDFLLEMFQKYRVTHETAHHILYNCNNSLEVLAYAREKGLIFREVPRQTPWRMGLSQLQRMALVQRLGTVINAGEMHIKDLLARHVRTVGYGKTLLQIEDEQTFANVAESIRTGTFLW
ncbi:hypothetical protein CBS101457_000186 [Exobasidium rhododendri]|nr:hypothetical protein CBS101457_000186 [Exobasidium rhododendri]